MPSYTFFNKQFMPLADASMGLMTHAFHYGTGAFEGIRGNWNPKNKQIYLFRQREHYQRLLDYIVPDFVHVLYKGKIVKSGGKELALELEQKGYDWIKNGNELVS